MSQLLMMPLAMVAFAAWVFFSACFPILAVWFCLDVRRSLRRIADAVERDHSTYDAVADVARKGLCIIAQEDVDSVIPSAFGR